MWDVECRELTVAHRFREKTNSLPAVTPTLTFFVCRRKCVISRLKEKNCHGRTVKQRKILADEITDREGYMIDTVAVFQGQCLN